MKCIIGLGNIGKEYESTRHNMGFMMVDRIAEKYNIKLVMSISMDEKDIPESMKAAIIVSL